MLKFVKYLKLASLPLLAIGLTMLQACKDEDGDINLFSVEDDKQFGAQVASEIESNRAEYPIIDSNASTSYIYRFVYGMRDSILNTGTVRFKDKFAWRIRLIKQDSVLNGFCTPGGYIYIYTGLIKFLDHESELAGVMGHEMAHADKRHSTDALTRQYGIGLLLDVVFGKDKGAAARIAAQLQSLSYSRKNESEADEFSVIWLNQTAYDGKGAAGFFQKLINSGQTAGVPVILSTHPDPGNRVQKITDKWQSLGSKVGNKFTSRYADFKSRLPR